MQTFKSLIVQTPEDKRRARAVKSAEENHQPSDIPSWFGFGKCAKEGSPDDFANDTNRMDGKLARARAKAVCRTCPFMDECFGWGQSAGMSGVFGAQWLRSGRPVPEREVIIDAA